MEKKTIGSFIAVLRRAKGLTQRELAEMLCVSDKAVSRWERDEALPDLSLIPVLAEIFEVTCDELLKGQRIDQASQFSLRTAAQTEKQLRNYIQTAKTKYEIHSIISLGLAVLGLFAAMLFNFGLLMSYVGFWVGTIFFAGAEICQLIFTVQAKGQIQSSMQPEDAIKDFKGYMASMENLVFTVILAFFGFSLPLATFGDVYYGLDWETLFPAGMTFCAIAVLLYWSLKWIISFLKRRIKGQGFSCMEKFLMKRIGCIVLILVLAVGGAFAVSRIDYRVLSKPVVFDTWDAFQAYIETPTAHDGEPLTFLETRSPEESTLPLAGESAVSYGVEIIDGEYTYDVSRLIYVFTREDGSEYEMPEPETATRTNSSKTILCTYTQWNRSVAEIYPNYDNDDTRLPVSCYTYTARNDAHRLLQTVTASILVIGMCASLWIVINTAKAAKKQRLYEET